MLVSGSSRCLSHRWIGFALIAIVAIGSGGCRPAPDGDEVPAPLSCSDLATRLTLNGPGLPVPPDAMDNKNCDWDVFAWNSFAALNWPVNTDKRGLPAQGTTFLTNADAGAELVWESFKEKRELFQPTPSTTWNDEEVSFATPDNLWDQFGGYCSEADKERAGTASSGPFALDKFHNQLDETAEVQSEAREGSAKLCQGHTTQPDGTCGIEGQTVGPRVWKGKPTDPGSKPVYYEVKVNYDFFSYVVNPPSTVIGGALYDDEVASTNALQGRIQLPWRTAATGTATNPNAVFGYPGTCDPYEGTTEGGDTVPCLAGAVHMKSAWIDMEGEDTDLYHTTEALFYETPESAPDKVCIAVSEFGLIGLHAIQRVMIDNSSTAENPGGAFVFATWEHRSILDESYSHPADYTYVNFQVAVLDGDTIEQPYPTLEYALPVTRMLPGTPASCGLSQEQTCQVNAQALQVLEASDSVWQNYRLVGTQFAPIDCSTPDDPAACRSLSTDQLAQPYYLANAVIETNLGLQQFQGLPPGQPRFQPPQWCVRTTTDPVHCLNDGTRKIPPTDLGGSYVLTAKNVTYGGQPLNMGGCQGCHGVAQQNGFSFSFVLLDGQGGAGTDTEQDAVIPPTNLAQTVPLNIVSVGQSGLALSSNATDPTQVVLVSTAQADAWRLVPFDKIRNQAEFPGQLVVHNVTRDSYLTVSGEGAAQGLTLAPLMHSGSTNRVSATQTFQLVGYQTGREVLLLNVDASKVVTVSGGAGTTVSVASAPPDSEAQNADQAFSLAVPMGT